MRVLTAEHENIKTHGSDGQRHAQSFPRHNARYYTLDDDGTVQLLEDR